jgi:hypothetical protein
MASPPAPKGGFGVARVDITLACAVIRPTSTRLKPVLALRGFDHWFLHSYTFPSCLPDPGRLAVPTRPVVVRAAPTLPCVSKVGLPSASASRCDGPQEESFHLLSVNSASWRTEGCEYWTPPLGRTSETSVWTGGRSCRRWSAVRCRERGACGRSLPW